MTQPQSPLTGTWTLNVDRSRFDANHQPKAGRMRIELDRDGSMLMNAEGTNEKGEPCAERPTRLHPDGRDYPVPDFAGLTVRTMTPDPHTLRTECRRENGTLVGAGTYVVSGDGRSLTATTSGWDTQFREFTQVTVWDREA